ncbi:hypothetical protein [Streptomyces sp. NPDC015131]|uniref:hypothetical protein n=1 Tax=Streptomyces sp. NPDC015131 TaxID=3364941 RepID=UPI0036FF85B1
MSKISRWVLAAVAAAVAVAVAVTLFVVQERREKAAQDAERESLRVAAQAILQGRADQKNAEWRRHPPAAGRVWSDARAKVTLNRVEMGEGRAKAWLQEITTPYTTDRAGADRRPDLPYAGMYVYVFEKKGGDWTLVKDVTRAEYHS